MDLLTLIMLAQHQPRRAMRYERLGEPANEDFIECARCAVTWLDKNNDGPAHQKDVLSRTSCCPRDHVLVASMTSVLCSSRGCGVKLEFEDI
jgi:hypothetical protein